MPNRKIIAADYHRNGISGTGFYVGLVEEKGRRMLVITFNGEPECTAVLDVDQAAAGNIYMHPAEGQPGGNAWRGDHYADLAPELAQVVTARFDKLYGTTT